MFSCIRNKWDSSFGLAAPCKTIRGQWVLLGSLHNFSTQLTSVTRLFTAILWSLILKTHHIQASKMELTFVNDLGNTFVVEIDPNMDLGSVMVLLEAEVSSTASSDLGLFDSYQIWLVLDTCRWTEYILWRARVEWSNGNHAGTRRRRERHALTKTETRSSSWKVHPLYYDSFISVF